MRAVRPRQVRGRARRAVPARLMARGRVAAVQWHPLAGGLGVDPAPQSGPLPRASSDGVFRAVGTQRVAHAPELWTAEQDGLLFLFHLHGFGELAADAADGLEEKELRFWSDVVESWLRTCDRPARPAWHPFPLSGRLIAWSAALSTAVWETAIQARMLASMQRQLLFLRRAVEDDVGGNHVIRNATALVTAGVCLADRRAQHQGLKVLAREVPRQVLADGGHEERSPSYHRVVLEDLRTATTVLARAGEPAPAWAGRLDEMAGWLAALTRPDGTVPLLNDAWGGAADRPHIGEAVTDLAASGYVVLRGPAEHVVIDVGELGPRHLPPHVHADALSVCLWADGRELITDPGTFSYAGPERDAFRATAAHATVEVDHADQCVFWGPFRAGLLPRVRRMRTERRPDGWVVVEAEHDGYRRLREPVVHRRTVAWNPAAGLVIVDRLIGSGRHRVASRLPLAPGLASAQQVGPFHVSALDGGRVDTEPGRHSPYFGVAANTTVLVQHRDVGAGDRFGWALLRATDCDVAVGAGLEVTGAHPLALTLE